MDEDTNGHVDNFACFNKPGEVILHWTDDKNDPQVGRWWVARGTPCCAVSFFFADRHISFFCPQYERSWDAFIRLSKETDAKGRSLRIHKMPQPGPLYYKESDLVGLEPAEGDVPRKVGDRLAASYVNFYMANEAIVVPQFLDPKVCMYVPHWKSAV